MPGPYTFGYFSEETRALQRVLSTHAPPFDTKGTDGIFGKDTRDAVQAAQEFYGIAPADGVVRTPLLVELGIVAPKPTFTIPGISEIGNIIAIFNQAKELQMNTANVDVISAWLSSKNWVAAIAILTNIAALFHIVIPPDLGPSISAVVSSAAALYIIIKNTWFTTSVTQASANNIAAGK